jgi:hypothetical protein
LYNSYVLLTIIASEVEARFFSFARLQNMFQGPLILLSNGYRGLFSLGIKRQEHETDHSSPTSTEIKNTSIYTSIPPYVFMV